jgi:hypothetical protein
VGDELARLVQQARQDYPPAAALMQRLCGEWVRAWGDGERVLPPRDRVAAPAGGPRAASMAETGVDPAKLAASWERFGAALAARRRVDRGA